MLLNDSREVFSLALKQLGYSNNSTDKGQVEQAFHLLKDVNQNVLAYDTDNTKQNLIAEEVWIAQIWSGDASYVNTENPNVSFVVPKEGTVVWADNICIPKGAGHKQLALSFINFMYDPDVSARNFNYMRLPNANKAALPKMDPAIAGNPILQYAETKTGLGEWLRDIGDGITLYDQLWTELKTGK